MERVTWKLTLPHVKQIAKEICCISQETQTGALYQPRRAEWGGRWEGGSRGRNICIAMVDSGEGNGNPLLYSCLENPMDGGAWQAAVHGVAKSQTRLSNFTFTFHFHALEKEMATHSCILAWRIPGTGDPLGCRLWGRIESDTSEATQQQQHGWFMSMFDRKEQNSVRQLSFN